MNDRASLMLALDIARGQAHITMDAMAEIERNPRPRVEDRLRWVLMQQDFIGVCTQINRLTAQLSEHITKERHGPLN